MKHFLSKNKNLIIAAVIICTILTGAFFMGGEPVKPSSGEIKNTASSSVSVEASFETSKITESSVPEETSGLVESSIDTVSAAESSEDISEPESIIASDNESSLEEETSEILPESEQESDLISEITIESVVESSAEESASSFQESVFENSCSLSIDCSTALASSGLNKKIKELQPVDGCILSCETGFDSGESAFDILSRCCRSNRIRLVSSVVPLTGGRYIERINDLGEFDCGSLSGWMVRINGEFIMVSCSDYKLHDGDIVEFLYTCDLGEDIGNHYIG